MQVKDDVDMVERNRDEETKRLQFHGVHFDFSECSLSTTLTAKVTEC